MSKHQEAWKVIKHTTNYDVRVFDDSDEEIRLIQELVDKATPKKLHKKANLTNKICPTCYLIFSLDKYDRHEKNNHCHNCGQALDWSEND